MTKRMFVAVFTVDDEDYGFIPGRDDIVHNLINLSEDGLTNWIVWDSAEDFISDHTESGPINLEYLTGEPALPMRSPEEEKALAPSEETNG